MAANNESAITGDGDPGWASTTSQLLAEFSTTLNALNAKFQADSSPSTSSTSSENVGGGPTGDYPRDLVSARVAQAFTTVLTLGACAPLSLLGVVANVLNLVVFARQGFRDSINVSLCAIAVADFSSAVTLLWYTICKNPLFAKADGLAFIPDEIEPLTSGIPHAIAMNATGWLTAWVSLERCLCVVFPLKVKDIFSAARTKVVVVAISVLVIGGQMPNYYTLRLGWRFEPDKNRTVLGLYQVEGSERIDKITFYIVNVTAPIVSFLIVWACSIVLIFKLHQKNKWRQQIARVGGKSAEMSSSGGEAFSSSSSSGKKNANEKEKEKETGTLSTRDWRVVKMVTIVAVIFNVSFTPYVLISTVMAMEPGFRFYGQYRYTFTVCVSVGALLESLNALSNTFIYYIMSSKFKATFRATFCRPCGGKADGEVSK